MGLAASTGLQPTTVLLFASWLSMTTGGLAVVAMRWMQGVVFQTLGKASSEIYYSAIHPRERRWVKPVIDTLVDRWSDAAVGVLLIAALHILHVKNSVIALVTAILAGVWLIVLIVLNRYYARAFRQALSLRWIGEDAVDEAMQLPQARKAILEVLRGGEENRILAALELVTQARSRSLSRAAREALRHPSPAVQAAAVRAMEALHVSDPEGRVETLLTSENEGLRAAAVSYLIGRTRGGAELACRVLDGEDRTLRRLALDALLEYPDRARHCLTASWIDGRMKAGTAEALLEAARALGAVDAEVALSRLPALLAREDPEVRRAALVAAARRPDRSLVNAVLPSLFEPHASREARTALAAIGDPAIPALEPALAGERSESARALAAHALADIGSGRAVRRLFALARSAD